MPRTDSRHPEPPRDLDSERMFLGAVVMRGKIACDPTAGWAVLTDPACTLEPADFYSDRHRIIYETLRAMHAEGAAGVDLETLADALDRAGKLGAAGGLPYLDTVCDSYGLLPDQYAAAIRRRAEQRDTLYALREARELLDRDCGEGPPDLDPPDVLAPLRALEERRAARSGAVLTLLDSAAFDAADFRQDYLVPGVLVAGQPGFIGAAFKSCKTLISADLAVCGALGVPFLGHFDVSAPFATVFLTGESGGGTMQANARSIAAARGAKLADLAGRVRWGLDPANMTDPKVLTELRRVLDRAGAGLLIADPFYLCVPLEDGEASQVGRMGAKLGPVGKLVADTGAAVLFNAHTRKRNAKLYEPPELGDLAGAGVAEWGRQWLLIGRRSAYDPDRPGEHELSITAGGSAGHSSRWAVDLAEYGPGGPAAGRRWSVQVVPWAEVREAERDTAAAKREATDRARERAMRDRAERHADELVALMLDGTADTKTGFKSRHAGMNGEVFGRAWAALLARDVLMRVDVRKGNRTLTGFALRERWHGPVVADHHLAGAFAVPADHPARVRRDNPGPPRDLFESVPPEDDADTGDRTAAPLGGRSGSRVPELPGKPHDAPDHDLG